jgi:hypothetical protein
MPALIFRAVVKAGSVSGLLVVPLFGLLIMSFSTILAFGLAKFLKLEPPTFGALLLAAAIGNTGYLGYPISLELFGLENLVKAVFYDLFGTVIFMFTVGLVIAEYYGSSTGRINKVKEIATFPPLIALVVALLLKQINLPIFLTKTIDYLGAATIPLIMLTIGLSLEATQIKTFKIPILIAVIIKLIISPAFALLTTSLFALPQTSLGIIVLEASMPTVMFSLIIGLKYGLDISFLPAVIVVTTLISMLTIPLWQFLVAL